MYKNNNGLITKKKLSKFKKRFVINRIVSTYQSATILILTVRVNLNKYYEN